MRFSNDLNPLLHAYKNIPSLPFSLGPCGPHMTYQWHTMDTMLGKKSFADTPHNVIFLYSKTSTYMSEVDIFRTATTIS